VDWGIRNSQTVANRHMLEQIQVAGELSDEEREEVIVGAALP
jgi:hypothetical protein